MSDEKKTRTGRVLMEVGPACSGDTIGKSNLRDYTKDHNGAEDVREDPFCRWDDELSRG
jgi:hypothetical protein